MEEALRAEVECPVCTMLMVPPIRQCIQGHLFCIQCFTKMQRCGICRSAKSNDRCLTLEKLYLMLTFACRYKDEGDGCRFTGNSIELAAHEALCTPIICPLELGNCQWQGKIVELGSHCKLEHVDDYFQSEKFVLFTGSSQTAQHRHILISVFDTLFLCSLRIEHDGEVVITVEHLGNPFITEEFCLNVLFITRSGLTRLESDYYKEYSSKSYFRREKGSRFSWYPAEVPGLMAYLDLSGKISRKCPRFSLLSLLPPATTPSIFSLIPPFE